VPSQTEVELFLAEGRREMESLMTDRCRVTAPGAIPPGPREFDDESGQYVVPARVVVYEGPCRYQVKADINANVVETTAGDREWTYLTGTLQLPVVDPVGVVGSVLDIRPDHVAEWLESPSEPDLVGRQFNIQGTYHKTHATHRRLRVREVIW
jgi:Family of unknown function (DUF6093)